MIISEFINAFARIEFKQQTDFTRFKDLKLPTLPGNRPGYCLQREKNLKSTLACDPELQAIDLPEVMDFFEQGKYDFNDLLFAQICRAKIWFS